MTTTNRFAIEPLSSFIESNTNPRTIFNPAKLAELAVSIKATGVIQPILVRPLPAARLEETSRLNPRPTLEIVAGARRFRGSKIAQAADIPTMIKDLTDDQVFEIQLIENLQRDDLTDLEAAEGYKTLMEHNHLTAEQVGQKVSKSRSSIYGSLKLLDLHPASKDALRSERITASAALLIARIPDIKLQDKAVAYAATPDGAGDKPSYRTFSAWLQRNVMLNLSYAPFDIEVVTLVPAAGSCNGCKKRTDADPDLFSDISNAALCIDPPCYHAKAVAHDALEELDDDSSGEDFGDGGLDMHALASAAARQAKTDPEAKLKHDIELLKNKKAVTIDGRGRIACHDTLIDHIFAINESQANTLLAPELLRVWLSRQVDDWDTDDLAIIFDIPPAVIDKKLDYLSQRAIIEAYDDDCKLRISRAGDADLYRYTAASLIMSDRECYTYSAEDIKPADLFEAYAKAHDIDLAPVRHDAAEQVEDETKEELAAINQALTDLKKPAETAKKSPAKTTSTTSTPSPAGAAIGTGEANAKKQKPAGASRKAKTTAQEAISGIAAAMQSIEAAPLGASLGGSEVAAGVNASLTVMGKHSKVKVLDGKHKDKTGFIAHEVGSDMWNVTLHSGVNLPFSTHLPTKSLQVIA